MKRRQIPPYLKVATGTTMDVRQVAAAMKVAPDTVKRWAADGRLPAAKTSRGYLFLKSEIAMLMKRDGQVLLPAPPSRQSEARKLMSQRLRFSILQRDGFRCRYCGRGPEDGVKLVVDHVLAIARGGTSDESNLQALCFDCNAGKADIEVGP